MKDRTMGNDHPYKSQPAKAFWRQTVSDRPDPLEIPSWYTKKWSITDARISAAGSCFAQHIGRHLRTSGFNFVDVEPPPPGLRQERWLEYGYRMYSARFGNIYTPRQLKQLLQRAFGEFEPAETAWPLGSGFVDPFRPTIEPQPLQSIEEVVACRDSHLRAVRKMFESTDVFVFTLGLTEAWCANADGAVFPVCPGTQGGTFDDQKYAFVNFSFPEVLSDLMDFMDRARSINGKMRFLFTVSPVPLAATATSQQVVVATTYSKAVLRAVAGQLASRRKYVDYFPSFEIISSPVMEGQFYGADKRSVSDAGVQHVMKQFFSEHIPPQRPADVTEKPRDEDDVVCDELLLEAFGEGKK
jgi:hypothetical protein